MIHADPMLARLAEHGYPNLPLRSTFVITVVALLLAFLTQNIVLAAMIGLLVLVGNGTVVHLLAVRDEQGSGMLLRLLRGGSAALIVLIVGAAVVAPNGAADGSRHSRRTLPRSSAGSTTDPAGSTTDPAGDVPASGGGAIGARAQIFSGP